MRYARAHRLVGTLTGAALIAASDLVVGAWNLSMPAATGTGFTVVPFRQELPAAVAALAVASMYSTMENLERMGGMRLRCFERAHVVTAILAAAALMWTAEAATAGPGPAGAGARSALIWGCAAVVSGRSFGWRLSWVLPVSTLFPLIYYGHGHDGAARWWNWPDQPANAPVPWLLAAASTLIAAAAFRATPWRGHALRRVHWPSRLAPTGAGRNEVEASNDNG
ncbi:hypothetical protein AB0M46_20200 [Dactylosporangium sp. NPDC051485]|uniref:hypothetical protein n=1 Tax=Dactylosporangium sp. NPDC051485 TaxID=3154846 RepID=UPI00343A547C